MSDTSFGYVSGETVGLFTDLYELTMLQGYHDAGHRPRATFCLFFRSLPDDRGYVIAAGLEQVIDYIANLSFDERALSYLADEGFGEEFLDWLSDWEFTGDVRALPEGTAVFPNEPMVEVTAPIEQAQLFETLLINQVGYQSLIATKAARMRDAVDRWGDGQSLVDFGSRRAHGTDAGMKAARAAYVGGFDGTSNVAAGEAFDLPIFGTMAHSWVQSFPTEREAFETFAEVYGEDTVLLIDTYDTVEGAHKAVAVAEDLDIDIRGVRLDSGDLIALSKEVADVVPADVDLFISSGVDEYFIREFLQNGGVGTGFGPGTGLTTSTDSPKLEGVYKLVAVEDDGEMQPTMKLSKGKVTYPGPKAVHRVAADGQFDHDVLAVTGEDGPGEDLLVDVFVDGDLVYDPPSLDAIQARAREQRRRLPDAVRAFDAQDDEYEVRISDGLTTMAEECEADLRRRLDTDRAD